MSRQLPPFAWLQAFEATARHLSFTRAAIELNITQTAVSHRIRNLERLLGTELFIRDGNIVRLTDVAHDFLSSTRTAIAEILLASERASHHDRGDMLTIACPGTFAIKCLIPGLPSFRKAYPNIDLRIRTLLPYRVDPRPDYDVAIQYGAGDWSGRSAERICSEEVFPVCSPALTRGPNKLRTPDDLRHHTIIRPVSPLIVADEWPRWLEAAGHPNVRFAREISCDLLYPSFQAAIDGLGIVMGRSVVVERDLASGLLVEPFKTRLSSNSGYFFFVSSSAEKEKPDLAARFRDWLIDYMKPRDKSSP
jgi:LysR family transcriptional regulator, glycine cleavage system transcriptional activator